MKNSDIRSQSLDLLRFPLALIVLTVHVFSTTGFSIQGIIVNESLLPNVQKFIDVSFRGQSVPIYYFISGYVFFLGVNLTWNKYKDKLKNRVKTLLIPYLIWNFIALLFQICIILLPISGFASKYSLSFSLSNILSCFWNYDGSIMGQNITYGLPILGPTGFLKDLMIVVLFTPIIYYILKNNIARMYLIVIGGLWLYNRVMEISFYFPISALFFFSLGAYNKINKKNMMMEFDRIKRQTAILYLLFFFISYYVYSISVFKVYEIFKSLNIFLGLVVAFNISVWLLKRGYCKVNNFLSSFSFFLYISHTIICGRMLKVLFIIVQPENDVLIFICYCLTIIFTTLFLMLIYYIMKQYTPAFLTFITGRK